MAVKVGIPVNGSNISGPGEGAEVHIFEIENTKYKLIDLMRFHRLLAGQYWVSEYGNPDNPEDAKFLRNYSAYE